MFGFAIGGGFYIILLFLIVIAKKVGVEDVNWALLGLFVSPICIVTGVLAQFGLKSIINSAVNQKVAETNKGQVTGEQVITP